MVVKRNFSWNIITELLKYSVIKLTFDLGHFNKNIDHLRGANCHYNCYFLIFLAQIHHEILLLHSVENEQKVFLEERTQSNNVFVILIRI